MLARKQSQLRDLIEHYPEVHDGRGGEEDGRGLQALQILREHQYDPEFSTNSIPRPPTLTISKGREPSMLNQPQLTLKLRGQPHPPLSMFGPVIARLCQCR